MTGVRSLRQQPRGTYLVDTNLGYITCLGPVDVLQGTVPKRSHTFREMTNKYEMKRFCCSVFCFSSA